MFETPVVPTHSFAQKRSGQLLLRNRLYEERIKIVQKLMFDFLVLKDVPFCGKANRSFDFAMLQGLLDSLRRHYGYYCKTGSKNIQHKRHLSSMGKDLARNRQESFFVKWNSFEAQLCAHLEAQ